MGYRWDCRDCNDHVMSVTLKKEHEKETGHRMWGGEKVYHYPNGDLYRWERLRNGYPEYVDTTEYLCPFCKLVPLRYAILRLPSGQVWTDCPNHCQFIKSVNDTGWTTREGAVDTGEDIDYEPRISTRKVRTQSKKRGCPQCEKSENIRYVSKGKLICTACDYSFEKGEKQ